MANGKVSLGYLRVQAQQRSDLENNQAVSDSEWNGYISNSYKELYDLLVGAYGNDYYMALPYQFSLTGSQFYPLPDGSASFLDTNGAILPAFYKLLGVDLQYSGSPSGWVSLRRFEFLERNKYAYPNTTININGYTNLKYRLAGSNLELIPIPATSQLAQIWYVPQPTSLQFAPSCTLTAGSATVTVSDVLNLTAGMSVYGAVGIPAGTTVSSVGSSSVVLSNAATTTGSYQTLVFYRDDTLIDGIAGWEEYVILDASLKACASGKSPVDDVSLMASQLEKMAERIKSMAEGRDIGQAHHVTDALSINGFGDYGDMGGFGGCGWGGY